MAENHGRTLQALKKRCPEYPSVTASCWLCCFAMLYGGVWGGEGGALQCPRGAHAVQKHGQNQLWLSGQPRVGFEPCGYTTGGHTV